MKEFLTKNFVSLIAIGLLVVLYLQRCGSPSVPPSKPDTIRVEYHYYHDSTTVSKPVIINQIRPTKEQVPPQMIPDTNYSRLKSQYEDLRDKYLTKNISVDSLKIDSGYVATTDTTQYNKIIGRRWDYHIRSTVIETTITKPCSPKNQIYLGGGLLGNKDHPVDGLIIGAFLKNKRDQVYKLGIQKTLSEPITYELSTYWKLKF